MKAKKGKPTSDLKRAVDAFRRSLRGRVEVEIYASGLFSGWNMAEEAKGKSHTVALELARAVLASKQNVGKEMKALARKFLALAGEKA